MTDQLTIEQLEELSPKELGEILLNESFKKDGDSKYKKLLISLGADLNIKNEYGLDSLHFATFDGHIDIVQKLLENGVSIKAINIDRDASLHVACSRGHVDIARMLIAAGASLEAKDRYGHTPWDVINEDNMSEFHIFFNQAKLQQLK